MLQFTFSHSFMARVTHRLASAYKVKTTRSERHAGRPLGGGQRGRGPCAHSNTPCSAATEAHAQRLPADPRAHAPAGRRSTRRPVQTDARTCTHPHEWHKECTTSVGQQRISHTLKNAGTVPASHGPVRSTRGHRGGVCSETAACAWPTSADTCQAMHKPTSKRRKTTSTRTRMTARVTALRWPSDSDRIVYPKLCQSMTKRAPRRRAAAHATARVGMLHNTTRTRR
jgi:hypothetical protein